MYNPPRANFEEVFRNIWPKIRDVIELLLKRGADANAKGIGGRRLLIEAARAGLRDAVELLIDYGADVNTISDSGRSALWHAKEQGHTEIVELLRKHGAKE